MGVGLRVQVAPAPDVGAQKPALRHSQRWAWEVIPGCTSALLWSRATRLSLVPTVGCSGHFPNGGGESQWAQIPASPKRSLHLLLIICQRLIFLGGWSFSPSLGKQQLMGSLGLGFSERLAAWSGLSWWSLSPLHTASCPLPGPKPPESLLLIPLPVTAATGLTPSDLAHEASL